MINIEDYKSYMLQNYNFLELLRENNSLVYDRLQDVLKVLGFVEMKIDDNKEIEEELDVFFEVGFSYLHEQLEEIKVYYDKYFKRDYPIYVKFEKFINYILYLSDLEETLKEKSLYTVDVKNAIDHITKEIDQILVNKNEANEDTLEHYNIIIEEHVPTGTLTTLEIYGMIVEELQL